MADWKRRGLIPADGLPDVGPLGWLVHDDVDSIVSAGYKFAADHPGVSTVHTGTANIDHVEKNVAAKEALPAGVGPWQVGGAFRRDHRGRAGAAVSRPPERRANPAAISMVGVAGIEPAASRPQTGRATAAPHPDAVVMIRTQTLVDKDTHDRVVLIRRRPSSI